MWNVPRKPFIAGNWKMNKNQKKQAFVEAVASKPADLGEAGIAAPAVDLTAVLVAAKGSNAKLLPKTLALKYWCLH